MSLPWIASILNSQNSQRHQREAEERKRVGVAPNPSLPVVKEVYVYPDMVKRETTFALRLDKEEIAFKVNNEDDIETWLDNISKGFNSARKLMTEQKERRRNG
jgi:hypothetical protein